QCFSEIYQPTEPIECEVVHPGPFTEAPAAPSSSRLDLLRGSVNWVWVVSNTSLVVPVVLAALALLVLATLHSKERETLQANFIELSHRQEADQKAHMERADRLLNAALALAAARPASASVIFTIPATTTTVHSSSR